MEHLIQFQLLTKSLSNDQFADVLHRIVNDNSQTKQILTQIIYDYYLAQFHKNCDLALPIHEFNKNIKIVVEQNKLQQIGNNTNNSELLFECCSDAELPDELENEPLTINNIPEQMIREIGSFLSLPQYTKFERCSRSMFCALRIPTNSIHCLNKHRIPENISLRRFKNVKELWINDETFLKSTWTNLSKIVFNMHVLKDDEVSWFLEHNASNLSSVKRIEFEDSQISAQSVCDLLSHCSSLEAFTVLPENGLPNIQITASHLELLHECKFGKMLQFINAANITELEPILEMVSTTLPCLSVYDPEEWPFITDSTFKFTNMKELHVWPNSDSKLCDLIKVTSEKLERFHFFDWRESSYLEGEVGMEDFSQTMNMLLRSSSFNSVKMELDGEISIELLETFRKAFENMEAIKQRIHVRIIQNSKENNDKYMNDSYSALVRLIDAMNKSVKQFKLELEIRFNSALVEKLKHVLKGTVLIVVEEEELISIITSDISTWNTNYNGEWMQNLSYIDEWEMCLGC